jgi:hypothetical protein
LLTGENLATNVAAKRGLCTFKKDESVVITFHLDLIEKLNKIYTSRSRDHDAVRPMQFFTFCYVSAYTVHCINLLQDDNLLGNGRPLNDIACFDILKSRSLSITARVSLFLIRFTCYGDDL